MMMAFHSNRKRLPWLLAVFAVLLGIGLGMAVL
jgi:hypothetical protein